MTNWIGDWATTAVAIIYLVDMIFAISIIFIERRNPSVTLAWICITMLFPLIGFLLYVFLSQNISRQRIFKISKNEEYFARHALEQQVMDMSKPDYRYNRQEEYIWRDMIRLNQIYGGAYYTENNDCSIYTDGKALMSSLFKDLAAAEKSINFETYILKNDEVGQALIKMLTKKAKEGVSVRLLVDAVGGRAISEKMLSEFREAGGRYAFFFKPHLRMINIRLNYRNHRKLVCIDGKTGYIGGFNVGREYLGLKKKFGYWRDTHLRVTGECVRDIDGRFILDWRQASKENISLESPSYASDESGARLGVQIVSSGPESVKDEIKYSYMKMITSAKRKVYIQTPYFIPDDSILDSLKMAAQSGVDVRLMIPCMPDHMFVYWATYSYAADLINSGCRVYIYDEGFLHSKVMVTDGEVISCGSANFDNRSFKLNFEANAFIYDSDKARDMEDIFMKDIEKCHELTIELYNSRGIVIKIKEGVSRLLSDLL